MDVLTIPQEDLSNLRLTELTKIRGFFQIDDISILGSDTSLQILLMGQCMRFPTMWYFDTYRLR